MTLTSFPNGIKSFGIPVLGSGGQVPATTGNYFFVDSGDGNDTNPGTDPSTALATIDAAVGKCTAGNGDVIVVMPGHAENISSGTSLVVDIAGVQIIGLGHGRNRPVLTYTNTAGSIEMDAANTRLSNIVLVASVSAVVVGINVDANDVTLDHLEFGFDATGDDFLTMIDVDAFDRCTIDRCTFIAESGAAGAAEAIRLDDTHFVRITDCWFSGQWSDAVIVGEGALGTDWLIANNYLYNADTTAANGIDINVASTGVLMNNRIGSLHAAAVAAVLDPGSLLCSENYIVNAVDETGIVVPTTAST